MLVVLCLLGGVAPAAPADARTVRPLTLRAEGRWLVDDQSRVRMLHGINVVYKRPPYVPSRAQFNEADARLIRSLGFNVVRLGIIWKAFEPKRDRYDYRYLRRIQEIVRMLGRHGIFTQLDFHQDIYNEKYGGEGFPDWAVFDDGLWTGAEPTVFTGWASRYLTPGVSRAFDNFWENREGIQDELIEAWTIVVQSFRDDPWVVGYDLLNEPWPGSMWPAFQTDLAEANRLQPFYEKAIAAIRVQDTWHTIWYEPSVTNDFGAANGLGANHPIRDVKGFAQPDNLGMSFHVYCIAGETVFPGADNNSPPCESLEERAWDEHSAARDRNDDTWFLSEFGATDDLDEIAIQADRADDHLAGWAYWSWKYYDDPTGAVNEGLVRSDTGRPVLKAGKARVLSRTYAQIVAGRPTHMSFDPQTAAFELRFDIGGADEPTTTIFVPVAMHYPKGYSVAVAGARVVSTRNAAYLRLRTLPGAETVEVTLIRR